MQRLKFQKLKELQSKKTKGVGVLIIFFYN